MRPQVVEDVGADQDFLIEMFERMEAFFRRLEIYIGLTPDQEMMDTVTGILVEVLNILAIATKEIKQGRISMCLLYRCVLVERTIFRKICKETDWKNGYRGCTEEARQANTRGGSNVRCATAEGHEYDR